MASKRLVDATVDDLRAIVREELDAREEKAQQAPSEIMDLKQAAGYIGIHPKTLARRAKAGTVPAHKIGVRDYRFFKSELRDSLRQVK
jgi:excisionase family DNA binding protein